MADDTYRVERSIRVDAPPQRMYDEIADFRRWRAWSPWEELDPQLERTYSGTSSGEGASYAWSGNRKAGKGHMTIRRASPPSSVLADLVFEKPFKSQSETGFTIMPDGAGSLVTWTMTGRKTLGLKVMGVFTSMDKLIGPDFEKGLARLKAVAESPVGGNA